MIFSKKIRKITLLGLLFQPLTGATINETKKTLNTMYAKSFEAPLLAEKWDLFGQRLTDPQGWDRAVNMTAELVKKLSGNDQTILTQLNVLTDLNKNIMNMINVIYNAFLYETKKSSSSKEVAKTRQQLFNKLPTTLTHINKEFETKTGVQLTKYQINQIASDLKNQITINPLLFDVGSSGEKTLQEAILTLKVNEREINNVRNKLKKLWLISLPKKEARDLLTYLAYKLETIMLKVSFSKWALSGSAQTST